jgi:hypothetical protein
MIRLKLLMRSLSGRGHLAYTGKRAKEEFAKQLISVSEKIFLATLLPILGFMLKPTELNLSLLIVADSVFIIAGLYLRHEGLKVLDDIDANRIEVVDANHFKP